MTLMEMLTLPMRCLLDTLTLATRDKKGEYFWDMRIVILRGRVSIGLFLLRGVFICSFEGYSEDSMYLLFSFLLDTLFLYMRSCDHLLTYVVLISLFILMYVFLSPTPSCVVSFLP